MVSTAIQEIQQATPSLCLTAVTVMPSRLQYLRLKAPWLVLVTLSYCPQKPSRSMYRDENRKRRQSESQKEISEAVEAVGYNYVIYPGRYTILGVLYSYIVEHNNYIKLLSN